MQTVAMRRSPSPAAELSEWHCSGLKSPWHEEHSTHATIELPLTGMDLREIRGRQAVVDIGTVAMHAGGEVYAVASPSAQPRRATCLSVPMDVMVDWAPEYSPGVVHSSARTACLHRALRRAQRDPEAQQVLICQLLDSVLTDAAHRAGRTTHPRTTPAWRRLANRLGERLALDFDQPLDLASLAGDCGVSAFHASRVFTCVTGVSLHRQLIRLRLRHALLQLPDMRDRLTELALSLGFCSHSHFSSAFRREFGHPPSAWDSPCPQSPPWRCSVEPTGLP